MFFKQKCGCKKRRNFPYGPVLISLGAGLMLAYIIPYYILVTILGVGLIIAGIFFLQKK